MPVIKPFPPIHIPPIFGNTTTFAVNPFFQISIVGGSFQDPAGNPLANGWLEWKLDHDSNIGVLGGPSGIQIVAGIPVKMLLDGNGNVNGNLWPNDQLTPEFSYYTVRVFNSQGLEVWATPQTFVLQGYVSGQVVNIGTLTPVLP